MARRRVAGGSRLDPGMFLQGQGGGSPIEQMGMALKLLGMGEERELGQMQVQELLSRYGGQQEFEEKKLASEEGRAQQQADFNNWLKQRQIDQDTLATQTKRDEIAAALQRSQDEFNAKAYELASPEERPFYLKSMSPQGRAAVVEMEALKQGNVARTQAPALEAAYKLGDWDAVKQIVGTLSPEVMARPEFKWQEWNQAQAGAAPTDVTGGTGLAGLLWNLPGVAQNVGKGVVNLASRGLMGSQAPQVPYTEFSNPMTEVPRYREAQAVLEALKAPGQSVVGPAPEEPMGGYTTRPVAQGTPWTYGTGTRNIPQETIAVPEAMPMPPIGETLSAGVLGMPPVSLGTLLRKLGIGAQGAEEPFGMPGEEEPMPWQYGVGGMR